LTVKAGAFFLASDFFRFSLFPAIYALPRSGRKKLSMFRMQRPTVPIHRATITENDWVRGRFHILLLKTAPGHKVHLRSFHGISAPLKYTLLSANKLENLHKIPI